MKKLFLVLAVTVVVLALTHMALDAKASAMAKGIGQAATLPFRVAGLAR